MSEHASDCATHNAPAMLPSACNCDRKRETAEQRGIMIGMAMSAAILVRDFDNPTLALEILGAAGIGSFEAQALDLDDYDSAPLSKLLNSNT